MLVLFTRLGKLKPPRFLRRVRCPSKDTAPSQQNPSRGIVAIKIRSPAPAGLGLQYEYEAVSAGIDTRDIFCHTTGPAGNQQVQLTIVAAATNAPGSICSNCTLAVQ